MDEIGCRDEILEVLTKYNAIIQIYEGAIEVCVRKGSVLYCADLCVRKHDFLE
jgi:hypothetical protein